MNIQFILKSLNRETNWSNNASMPCKKSFTNHPQIERNIAMKTKPALKLAAAAVLLAAINFKLPAGAQGTAFTYQGRLDNGGVPVTGNYDFQFYLRDALSGGNPVSITNAPTLVGVSNGLFTVTLDFGNDPFAAGAPRWLEIGVRTNGGPAYLALAPRQALTAVPYAMTAGNLTGTLPGNALSGTYSGALNLNNPANIFSGVGSGLTGLNAANISSGTLADQRLSANVALLDHTQTFTGNNTFGDVSLSPPSTLSFGVATRQMINLWSTSYGIGVQPSTHYFRADSGASFAWYEGASIATPIRILARAGTDS
jgi:hypothetical protein